MLAMLSVFSVYSDGSIAGVPETITLFGKNFPSSQRCDSSFNGGRFKQIESSTLECHLELAGSEFVHITVKKARRVHTLRLYHLHNIVDPI